MKKPRRGMIVSRPRPAAIRRHAIPPALQDLAKNGLTQLVTDAKIRVPALTRRQTQSADLGRI